VCIQLEVSCDQTSSESCGSPFVSMSSCASIWNLPVAPNTSMSAISVVVVHSKTMQSGSGCHASFVTKLGQFCPKRLAPPKLRPLYCWTIYILIPQRVPLLFVAVPPSCIFPFSALAHLSLVLHEQRLRYAFLYLHCLFVLIHLIIGFRYKVNR
jgi:hypothetical protein